MLRLHRRPRTATLAVLSWLLTSLLSVGVVATPAHAAGGRCAEGTGVTVVVDNGSLGGGVRVGCAPGGAGQPGAQVVTAAGFPLTFVSGEPFVCRIGGLPTAQQEDCSATPPADAYWGLFWSDGDPASWSYATIGITGLDVPEGGSIGWRWQDGGARDLPTAAPNAKPVDKPAEEPSDDPREDPSDKPRDEPRDEPRDDAATEPSTGTGEGDSQVGAGQAAGPTPGAPTRSPATSPSSRPGAGPRASKASDPATARERARRADKDAAADRRDGDSAAGAAEADGATTTRALEPVSDETAAGGSTSVTPWLAGAVLVGLGAAAAVLGRRRRSGG